MNLHKALLPSIAVAVITAASSAQAGPPVTVTFKNLGAEAAQYSAVTSNEVSTQRNAKSPISSTIKPGEISVYTVQSNISPDMSYASVRYVMGAKVCVFSTTFSKLPAAGGVRVPKWTRTATPSGGAVCTATARVTDLSSHAWAAEFTMK
ncbi:hypothetical protein TRP66_12675 [Pseudomonas sp. JDS28PS106]|uniref:hypothetical protein n=1 Tax=Pseudomonas sp. JDS28PS106 TaxID=2497235 RepID=UPI002FD6A42E